MNEKDTSSDKCLIMGSWCEMFSVYDNNLELEYVKLWDKERATKYKDNKKRISFVNKHLKPFSLKVSGWDLELDLNNSTLFFLTFGEFLRKTKVGDYYFRLDK